MALRHLKKFKYVNNKFNIIETLLKNKNKAIIAISIIAFIVIILIIMPKNSKKVKVVISTETTKVEEVASTETLKIEEVETIEETKVTEDYDGERFITEHFPIFKDVVFVGDSYAHNMAIELGFDTTVYSSPGLTLQDLQYCFNSAKENAKKYVVIFVGPNDFRFNVDPEFFGEELDKYVNIFDKDSKIIICTYLSTEFTDNLTRLKTAKYSIPEYDYEIRKIVRDNDNTYYFDLSDLEGKPEYYKKVEDDPNRIHFNYKFYIEFINKLYDFILSIK